MTDTTALAPSDVPGAGARCAVHPDRAARVTCSRCGNFACEECETRSDSGALVCKSCEAAGPDGDIPWEKRAELGIPKAFVQTAIAILLRPWEFFSLRARERSILPAMFFGWIATAPSSLLGMISNLFSMDAQRAQLLLNPMTRDILQGPMAWVLEPPFQIGVGVGALLLWPLVLGTYTILWQLTLMPFGAAKRPIKETARALSYVHVVSIPMIVMLPFVTILNVVGLQAIGGVVALPFIIYSWSMAGIAMWKTHSVDGWRIFAAVGFQLFLFVALCCVLAGLIVAAALAAIPLPLR